MTFLKSIVVKVGRMYCHHMIESRKATKREHQRTKECNVCHAVCLLF